LCGAGNALNQDPPSARPPSPSNIGEACEHVCAYPVLLLQKTRTKQLYTPQVLFCNAVLPSRRLCNTKDRECLQLHMRPLCAKKLNACAVHWADQRVLHPARLAVVPRCHSFRAHRDRSRPTMPAVSLRCCYRTSCDRLGTAVCHLAQAVRTMLSLVAPSPRMMCFALGWLSALSPTVAA
jgi:hypothetical protein